MSKQRRYSAEFKLDAVSRMEHCETITGLAKELGIRRKFNTNGVSSYGPTAKRRWSGAHRSPRILYDESRPHHLPQSAKRA